MTFEPIFQIFILVMSVVLHEVSHGYAARALGDKTAEWQGRLTLNPLAHLEPFGSVILPILTHLAAGITVGWAKPVPYNPFNLKHPKRDEGLIAFAGPVSNACIAVVFSVFYHLGQGVLSEATLSFFVMIVITNVALGLFNLCPFPPLDGSKILWSVLPEPYGTRTRVFLDKYAMIFILFLFTFAGKFIGPLVMKTVGFLLG